MKHVIVFSFVLTTLLIRQTTAQVVDIPDAGFLQALIIAGVDTNMDGKIQNAEAAAITNLSVAGANIDDLTGIESFVNVDTLNCSDNRITSLDLTNNTRLIMLYTSINKLTSLIFADSTVLKNLSCSNNDLSELDVSGNPELESLDCGFNHLTRLDVSANPKLQLLECYSNELDSLDLSQNPLLVSLYCFVNKIKSLDLSENTELIKVDCQFNQLNTINLSNNTKLTDLACFSNRLISLDVTHNPLLARLDCGLNLYPFLDLQQNDSLVSVDCSQNPNLEYICVKDTAFVSNNINFFKDAGAQWTENCNTTTGLDKNPQLYTVALSPNPGRENFNLLLQQPADITIYNAAGAVVEHYMNIQQLLIGQNYQPGLYVVSILFSGHTIRKVIKVIKE